MNGFHYVGGAPERSAAAVYRLDLVSGRSHRLGMLPSERSLTQGLAVSPDRRTILFASRLPWLADLFLIEDFR